MRNKRLAVILGTFLIFIFSITASGYALPKDQQLKPGESQNDKFKSKHNDKYHKLSRELLLENLGLTKEEVKEAKKAGKSIYDLAKEKGKTLDQVKNAMIDAKTKAIMQAVKDGKLTKEQGEERITHFKEKIIKWDGTMKHKCRDKDRDKN